MSRSSCSATISTSSSGSPAQIAAAIGRDRRHGRPASRADRRASRRSTSSSTAMRSPATACRSRRSTDTVAAALGGREAGLVFEGDRRFDIVVRLDNATRDDLDADRRACRSCCPKSGAGPRAFGAACAKLASFQFSEGVNQVSRENGQRRVVVQANVRGSDLGSFVEEARAAVAERGASCRPACSSSGAANMRTSRPRRRACRSSSRSSSLLIFGILFLALRSVAVGAGRLFGGAARPRRRRVRPVRSPGCSFSISAAVGFIVLSGVTVLNGLVVMTSIRQRHRRGRAGRRGDRAKA